PDFCGNSLSGGILSPRLGDLGASLTLGLDGGFQNPKDSLGRCARPFVCWRDQLFGFVGHTLPLYGIDRQNALAGHWTARDVAEVITWFRRAGRVRANRIRSSPTRGDDGSRAPHSPSAPRFQ